MKKLVFNIIYFTVVLVLFSCTKSNNTAKKNVNNIAVFPKESLDSIIKSYPTDVAFVMKNINTQEEYIWGESRSKKRFPIASTFKMLNTLIALQEGIIIAQDTIKWDGVDRPFIKEWNQDQTLASAYKYSTVWVYQKIARELNREIYQKYLDEVNLGNKTIGKDVDTFWLDGSLQISCVEQIDFLNKLAHKNLPFNKNTLNTGEQIMTEVQNDSIQLIAKTGMYLDQANENVAGGWYIGYVKKHGKPELLFALNLKISEKSHRTLRKEIVHQLLKQLQYLP